MAGEVYLSNLVGNFDYKPILDKFRLYKSQQIFFLQDKENLIKQKKSAYKEYYNLLDGFKDTLDQLLSPSLFSEKSVSISDETVLDVTITNPEKVTESNLDISVIQLAQNDVWLSNSGKNDKNAAMSDLNSGTITISYDTGSININYDNTDSLQSIVDKINSEAKSNNLNINASLFFDGTNYRLMIKGLDTGSSKTVSISDSNTGAGSLLNEIGGFNNVQQAQNAQISIYGTTVESETNRFNNVLDGVNIEVKKKTSSPVNVSISKNYQPLKDNLQNLIDKYNQIVDFTKNKAGKNGVLSGDSTIQSVRSQIFKGLFPLMELGIFNVDKDTGHISIDSEKLDKYINSDIDQLKTKISELSTTLKDYVYFAIDPEGPLKSKEKSFDRQVNNIEKKIEIDTKRINEEIETMKKQFIALQMYMAQMEDVRQRLSAVFGIKQQQ